MNTSTAVREKQIFLAILVFFGLFFAGLLYFSFFTPSCFLERRIEEKIRQHDQKNWRQTATLVTDKVIAEAFADFSFGYYVAKRNPESYISQWQINYPERFFLDCLVDRLAMQGFFQSHEEIYWLRRLETEDEIERSRQLGYLERGIRRLDDGNAIDAIGAYDEWRHYSAALFNAVIFEPKAFRFIWRQHAACVKAQLAKMPAETRQKLLAGFRRMLSGYQATLAPAFSQVAETYYNKNSCDECEERAAVAAVSPDVEASMDFWAFTAKGQSLIWGGDASYYPRWMEKANLEIMMKNYFAALEEVGG